MSKAPDLHPYSDRTAFQRLMLLISAIARNPGIGPQSSGVSPIQAVLTAMQAIATEQGREWQDWSEATIRKDLETLRQFGILPTNPLRQGYRLATGPEQPRPPKQPGTRKSRLTVEQMQKLHDEGLPYEAIAQQAGISRGRVGQLLKPQ